MGILNLTGDSSQSDQPSQAASEVQDAQTSTQSTDAKVSTAATDVKEDTAKTQVVIMDGPLSHIYTEALNMAYAKEDTGTMAMKIVHQSQRNGASLQLNPALVDEYGSYVYAIDDKSLDQEGLVPVLESLRKAVKSGQYKQVVLALEARVVNAKMQLLDEASTQMGVQVRVSRSSALHAVLNACNKA